MSTLPRSTLALAIHDRNMHQDRVIMALSSCLEYPFNVNTDYSSFYVKVTVIPHFILHPSRKGRGFQQNDR